MAEGFTCDRCGAVHPGSPHGTISTADGVPRTRPGDYKEFEPDGISTDTINDVCESCLDAFEEWWDGA